MGWDAAPLAHVWPTLRPGTSGRLVLPAQRSGARPRAKPCVVVYPAMLHHEHHSPDCGDVVVWVAVHGTRSASFPSASDPIRSSIPSDSADTDVPLSNASMGLSPPSC